MAKPAQEMVATFTTAPADYDWGTTRNLGSVGTKGGKVVRMVETPANRAEAQRDRYASGLAMAVGLGEWRKLVALKLADASEAAAVALHALDVAEVTKLALAIQYGEARAAGLMVDALRFGGEGWNRPRIVAALASHGVTEGDFENAMEAADDMEAAS